MREVDSHDLTPYSIEVAGPYADPRIEKRSILNGCCGSTRAVINHLTRPDTNSKLNQVYPNKAQLQPHLQPSRARLARQVQRVAVQVEIAKLSRRHDQIGALRDQIAARVEDLHVSAERFALRVRYCLRSRG